MIRAKGAEFTNRGEGRNLFFAAKRPEGNRGAAASCIAPLWKGSCPRSGRRDWIPSTTCLVGAVPAAGWDGRMRLRAAGRGNPPSRRGTVGPTISFLERDGAAWRYQRKIAGAQKLFCPPEAKMRPGTPPSLLGCALTQPKSPVQKEGAYGGTWFPRQITRGPRCGAALRFRRSAAIGGPGGHFIFRRSTHPQFPPGAFLLDRSSGPFSFRAKREWGAGEHPPWRGVTSAPSGRTEQPRPLRGKTAVRLRRNL